MVPCHKATFQNLYNIFNFQFHTKVGKALTFPIRRSEKPNYFGLYLDDLLVSHCIWRLGKVH